jgi:hypothetical protein
VARELADRGDSTPATGGAATTGGAFGNGADTGVLVAAGGGVAPEVSRSGARGVSA